MKTKRKINWLFIISWIVILILSYIVALSSVMAGSYYLPILKNYLISLSELIQMYLAIVVLAICYFVYWAIKQQIIKTKWKS